MDKFNQVDYGIFSFSGDSLFASKQVIADMSFSDILRIVADLFEDDNITRVVIDNYAGMISIVNRPIMCDEMDFFIDCKCGYANPHNDAYFGDELEVEPSLFDLAVADLLDDDFYPGEFTDIEREAHHKKWNLG